MIFFFNAQGVPIRNTPERVFQGSNKANTIYFVCPTAPTNVVSVAFRLPNGDNTIPYIMTADNNSVLDGVVDADNNQYYLWSFEIPSAITAFVGVVNCQFSIVQPNGVIVTTGSTSFNVEYGVNAIDPEQGDSYEEVLAQIATILSEISGIKSNITEINTEVSAINSAIEEIDNSISDLSQTANSLDERITQNRLLISGILTEVSDINSEINDINIEVTDIQKTANDNSTDIDNIYTILGQTVVTDTEVEDTYNSRITAEGMNIIDGAKTTVHKIKGASTALVNLLNIDSMLGTVLTKQTNGSYKLAMSSAGNTFTANAPLNILANTTIYVRVKVLASVPNSSTYARFEYDDGTYYYASLQKEVGESTTILTLPNNIVGLKLYVPDADTTYTFEYIQITLTETDEVIPYGASTDASFKGIESTGRNLLNIDDLLNSVVTKQTDGTYLFKSTSANDRFSAKAPIKIAAGTTAYYLYDIASLTGEVGVRLWYEDGTVEYMARITRTGIINNSITTIKKNVVAYELYSDGGDPTAVSCTINHLQITLTNTTEVIPYISPDTSFALDNPVTLQCGDYIDVEKQQVVRKTRTIEFTGGTQTGGFWWSASNGKFNFTTNVDTFYMVKGESIPACVGYLYNSNISQIANKQFSINVAGSARYFIFRNDNFTTLDDWKAHLVALYEAGTPLTITYETAEVQSTEGITIPTSYIAYKDGMEVILQETADGINPADYGVECTVTQDYYVKRGITYENTEE